MNASGLAPFIRLTFLACFGAFCLHPAAARNVASPTSLVEAKLGGETILSSAPAKLVTAVKDSVTDNPTQGGHIIQAVLGGGRADADAIAPQVTAAAILALGTNPVAASVSDIVYASVKATPAVVLEIVKAAVKTAPGSAKAIVRAAVKAIPNPTDKIQPLVDRPTDPGLSKDAKDMPQPAEDPLPIGEAIANAAHEADPSLSLDDLMNTVRQASLEKPGVPPSYPGYYYPPFISGGPTPRPGGGTPPVPTPPVVSQ